MTIESACRRSVGDPPISAAALAGVGGRVCGALGAVLEPVGGARARPTDVAARFGLNKSVASRLLKALRTQDAAAALGLLPGPEALRSLLAAAEGSDADVLRRARDAVDEFDRLVRMELGGLDGLAAILSESIPELRERFELGHKQSAYRAMSNLMGLSAEVNALTLILWPNADDPDRLDAVNLHTLSGVRQRRPGCSLDFSHRFFTPDPSAYRLRTIDGAVPGDARGFIVWARTSIPEQRVSVVAHETHQLLSVDIGPLHGDGHDLMLATVQRRAHFARPQTPGRTSGVGLTVDVPTRLGVVEVLMPPGVWAGRVPRTFTHVLGSRGAVDPNDPTRASDEIRLYEKVEVIDWQSLRIAEVHDHPGAVELVSDRIGVDARALSGFRVRSSYPLVGTQLSLDFPPP